MLINFFEEPEYKAYQYAIESLADNPTDYQFSNSNETHAAIVLGNIFRTAEKNVYVFAESYQSEVVNKEYFLFYLRQYLEKGKIIYFLFEKEPEAKKLNDLNLRKAWDIITMYKNQCNIKILKFFDSDKTVDNNGYKNFTISDSRMYRYEKAFEKSAECSFNNVAKVKMLNERFFNFFTSGNDYKIA